MIRGLYTSTSSLATLQRDLEIHANNLANANTPGFKRSLLLAQSHPSRTLHDTSSAARYPGGLRTPHRLLGPLNTGVSHRGSHTDYGDGPLEKTDNPLDLALRGEGFFAVRLEGGGRGYTRNGSFRLNTRGELVDASNRPVLGRDGIIQVPQDVGEVNVLEDGLVVDGNNRLLGELRIVRFASPQRLDPVGAGTYRAAPDLQPLGPPGDTAVRQGYLEASNVNPIDELGELIELNRTYELNTRLIKEQDNTLQQTTRDVGRA